MNNEKIPPELWPNGLWISTADRLPEDGQRVLVCVGNWSIKIQIACFCSRYQDFKEYDYGYLDKEVTHWMILPAAPRDGETK